MGRGRTLVTTDPNNDNLQRVGNYMPMRQKLKTKADTQTGRRTRTDKRLASRHARQKDLHTDKQQLKTKTDRL